MSDLAERAARGEREAMAKIVAEHYAAVYAFCARRLGRDLAEDAAQETFIMATKTIKRYDPNCALRTWLIGIALNVSRNLARKKRREIDLANLWHLEANTPGEDSIVAGEHLRAGLKQLKPDHLEVMVLHELDELTYEECAQVLDIPVGTVKSRLHEAFRQLRAAMGAR